MILGADFLLIRIFISQTCTILTLESSYARDIFATVVNLSQDSIKENKSEQ
jgi:hypothetical protein